MKKYTIAFVDNKKKEITTHVYQDEENNPIDSITQGTEYGEIIIKIEEVKTPASKQG